MPNSEKGELDEYIRSYTFEASTPRVVTADEETIALGYDDGPVELVGTGRTTIDLDVRDIALATRLYALTGERITAISRAGTEVWSTEWSDAERVAATDNAVALLTPENIIGLDSATGVERFRTKRPFADIAGEPTIIGGAERFVIAAWSFLAVVNDEGVRTTEVNIDGAIETAGLVGDTAIIALRDGRLIGCDVTSGTVEWERESRVDWLPPSAMSELPAVTTDRLLRVTPDGVVTEIAKAPSGEVYVAGSGDPVCAVGDGIIACYRLSRELSANIDVALATDRIARTANEFHVTVGNDGSTPTTVPLSVSGTGITFDPERSSTEISVGTDADRTVTFPVARIGDQDRAEVTVSAADETVVETTLEVVDPDPDRQPINVETTVERITEGEVRVDVAIENRSSRRIENLVLQPVDERLPTIDPEATDSHTTDVAVPIMEDLRVTWEDESAEIPLNLRSSTDTVSLAIETIDNFVDITIDNGDEAPFQDELRVDGSAVTPIERTVEVPSTGQFLLALRPHQGGAVRAAVKGLGLSDAVEFEAETGLHQEGGKHDRADSHDTDANDSGSRFRWEQRSGQGASETDADSNSSSQSVFQSDLDGETSQPNTMPSVEHEMAIERGTVEPWAAVQERVTVTNDTDTSFDHVAVESTDGGSATTDTSIPSGKRATFTRYHAFPPGEGSLPDVSILVDLAESKSKGGGTRIKVPTVDSPTVEREGFGARLIGERRPEPTLTLQVWNDGDSPIRITSVRVAGHNIPDPNDWTIEPGETDQRSVTIEGQFESSLLRAIVQHVVPGDEETQFQTLVPVLAADSDPAPPLNPPANDDPDDKSAFGDMEFDFRIGDISSSTDGDSAIVDLAVRNETDEPHRVRVTPKGEELVDVLAMAMTETVDPGAVEPFGVHVATPPGERQQIEFEAVIDIIDNEESFRIQAVGTNPDDNENSDGEISDEWTIELLSPSVGDIESSLEVDRECERPSDDGRLSTPWES